MNPPHRAGIRALFTGTVCFLCAVGATAIGGCTGDAGDAAGEIVAAATGQARSSFTAVQVDPQSEDSAGPQFVRAADVNGDGLIDLVSAWDQSQPVQIHLQRRGATGAIRFETVTLAGNIPVISVAGLEIADFDQDGRLDIAVLIKESLLTGASCLDNEVPQAGSSDLNGVILLYFGPTDSAQANQALAWIGQEVKSSYLLGAGDASVAPEIGGFTSMAVGDLDMDGDPDIVVAWNPACNQLPEVLVFTNDGPGAVRVNGTWTVQAISDPFNCTELTRNCSEVRDVALGDIDRDGDLDIVATFPFAGSMNVRWYRNPALVAEDADGICYRHDDTWKVGSIGQVATGADIVRLGDIDSDGILDAVVRSAGGGVIQWFKGPNCPTTPTTAGITDDFRNIPWQVYTLAEFPERAPEAIALVDINGDGRLELVAAAEGGVAWFDPGTAETVFDQWRENLILDDNPDDASDPATTDPNADPEALADTTRINSITVVDLDGNGTDDFVLTLDRAGLSGLTNDALIWFRNN